MIVSEPSWSVLANLLRDHFGRCCMSCLVIRVATNIVDWDIGLFCHLHLRYDSNLIHLCYVPTQALANLSAVSVAKFGTHMWDLSALHASSTEFLVVRIPPNTTHASLTCQSSFLANWPTAIIWAVAKTTFFLMYLQIFSPFRWLRICVYIGLFVTWGFYIAVLIPSIYYMAPNPGQSWQEGFTNPRYLKSLNLNMPIAIGSLILDVYIFLLPLVAVPKLRLSPRKKVGVAAVFATGFM